MQSPWKIPPGHFGTGSENIKILRNFIDADDVKRIYEFSKTINEWETDGKEDEYNEDGVCTYSSWYWKDRQCSSEILQRLNPEIHAMIDFYIDKMATVAGQLFDCELEKRPPCIIRWFAGIEQQPHADKQLIDGSPNPFQSYDINSLFYYNDDFEGGELYYPEFDIVVKPEPGLAVIHPGDIHYLHGVKMITSGERFTTPAFYTVKD